MLLLSPFVYVFYDSFFCLQQISDIKLRSADIQSYDSESPVEFIRERERTSRASLASGLRSVYFVEQELRDILTVKEYPPSFPLEKAALSSCALLLCRVTKEKLIYRLAY